MPTASLKPTSAGMSGMLEPPINISRDGNLSSEGSNSRYTLAAYHSRESTTESETTAGRIHQLQAQQ
jgi:hypothetical protein